VTRELSPVRDPQLFELTCDEGLEERIVKDTFSFEESGPVTYPPFLIEGSVSAVNPELLHLINCCLL